VGRLVEVEFDLNVLTVNRVLDLKHKLKVALDLEHRLKDVLDLVHRLKAVLSVSLAMFVLYVT